MRCSFCHKSKDVVDKLISSPVDDPQAYICDECVAVCNAILEDARQEALNAPKPNTLPKPNPLKEYLDQEVIGPDSVPKKLSLVVAEHRREQGKIVLLGPASGLKTRVARMVAQLLQIPFAIVDATGFTPQS
jgi:ATP-dependent Clp protease ATP-binding subunit ClpX